MSDINKTDQYVEHINSHILPFIDYDELQASYDTDMVYAKGILNRLHEAMVTVYGSEQLDEMDGDEGFVIVPGVVRGKNTGNMALALLDLDLSSSGEHWGTTFLCKYGVVSQNEDRTSPAGKKMAAAIGSYDYCYTAAIPGDIHVDKSRLPEAIKSVLGDFRNHHTELVKNVLRVQEKAAAAQERVAMLDVIGQFEKSRHISERNRMTWFHNDMGEYRAKSGVTDEHIAARYGEVLEKKLEHEEKRSAAAIPDHVHGYEVKQAVCFSNDRGFALAENPRAAAPFVTWQFTEENGKQRDYYWGHYFAKAESAEKDFGERVDGYRADYPTLTEKYNYLAAAEMSAEQNYNMLDGSINNVAPARADLTDGQTYDEIKELAPETLPDERPSVTEKLAAAKQAVKEAPEKPLHEKKPSELERG